MTINKAGFFVPCAIYFLKWRKASSETVKCEQEARDDDKASCVGCLRPLIFLTSTERSHIVTLISHAQHLTAVPRLNSGLNKYFRYLSLPRLRSEFDSVYTVSMYVKFVSI